MPWMPSLQTGNLIGVADAAAHIATTIVDRTRRTRGRTRVLNSRLA
jgi:hypothetical protein